MICIASKVLEHIVYSHMHVMKRLEQHKILKDVQHGFRTKRSTVTKLIKENKTIHAAILDFSKAFDKVPHHLVNN